MRTMKILFIFSYSSSFFFFLSGRREEGLTSLTTNLSLICTGGCSHSDVYLDMGSDPFDKNSSACKLANKILLQHFELTKIVCIRKRRIKCI